MWCKQIILCPKLVLTFTSCNWILLSRKQASKLLILNYDLLVYILKNLNEHFYRQNCQSYIYRHWNNFSLIFFHSSFRQKLWMIDKNLGLQWNAILGGFSYMSYRGELKTGGRLTENQLIKIVFFQLIKIFIISWPKFLTLFSWSNDYFLT